jgi:hypothetical protein
MHLYCILPYFKMYGIEGPMIVVNDRNIYLCLKKGSCVRRIVNDLLLNAGQTQRDVLH